jgi:integrase
MRPIDNKFNFTEASISSLPFAPKGKRYNVYDTSTKNLAVRVGENSKIFYLIKKINGRVMNVRLADFSNTSVKDARDLLITQIKEINSGKNPNIEKQKIREDLTIKEFFNTKFVPLHSNRPTHAESTRKMEQSIMKLYLKDFHNKKMIDITHADVEILHKKLETEISGYLANHELRVVRQMFNRAIVWGCYHKNNPVSGLVFAKEESRDRFLLPDELERLFTALKQDKSPQFSSFVMLCLFLGQRRRNIQSMKWSDINFAERSVYFPTTKTKKPVKIPIPAQVMSIFDDLLKFKKNDWVFPSATAKSGHLEEPKNAWKALLKRAGLENVRMHDLRRTYATYQASIGSSNEIIGKALGDKTPAVISVYARIPEDTLRDSIQGGVDKMIALGTKNK